MSKRKARKIGKVSAAAATATILATSGAGVFIAQHAAGATTAAAFSAAQTSVVNTDASHGVMKDPNGKIVGRFAGTPGTQMKALATAVDSSDGSTYVSAGSLTPGGGLTPAQYQAGGYSVEKHLQDLGVPQTQIDKFLHNNPNMAAATSPSTPTGTAASFTDASGTAHHAVLAGSITNGTIYESGCAVLTSSSGATWASCHERFSIKDSDPNADYRPDDAAGFGYGTSSDNVTMGYTENEYSGYVRIVSHAPLATMPGTAGCATGSVSISDGVVTLGYAFPICLDKVAPMWDGSLTYMGAKWTGRTSNSTDSRAAALVDDGRIGCFCTDGYANIYGWSHT